MLENHLISRTEEPQILYQLTVVGEALLPLRDELARFGQAYQQFLFEKK